MIARKAKVIAPLAVLVAALAGPAAAKSGIPLTPTPVLDQAASAVILATDKKKAKAETETKAETEKKQAKKQTADNPEKKKKKKKKSGKKTKNDAAG
ncbi:hypothetical protein [Microbaculum marinisediminis]|uniref:Uncharacterized protein n=1 Tax=Microbaculum marinisediminis TaxID=2931392 RepID=A0AAW5R4X7_9HYPH|nr:hypothetical protein [Microbaculum sp. A6E488]MCT8974452.1 hypothetical protein [Microbaculum sp. A6E488]